eukprot:14279325-Alexandrium_andersonii.AAC.1
MAAGRAVARGSQGAGCTCETGVGQAGNPSSGHCGPPERQEERQRRGRWGHGDARSGDGWGGARGQGQE